VRNNELLTTFGTIFNTNWCHIGGGLHQAKQPLVQTLFHLLSFRLIIYQ
jgi:hypothetical protein